jgi:ATP-binding cassette, subfamily B, bacterial
MSFLLRSRGDLRPPDPPMNAIFRIARYFVRYRAAFAATLLLALGSTAFLITVPLVIRFVIDGLADDGQPHFIWIGVGAAAACFLGRDLLNFARIRVNNNLEQKVLVDLRKDVHDKLLDMSVSYYENTPSGEIASRVIEDVQNVERVILDGTEQGMVAVVMAFGVAGMLFWLQPTLALLVVIPLPILVFLGVDHARATRRNWARVREAAGSLNALLVEHLQGHRLISAFALAPRERGRFMTRALRLRDATLKAMLRWSIYSPATSFISSLGVLAVLGYGGFLLMEGRMTPGTFVGFYAYCAMLYEPVTRLNQLNHLISAGRASGDRVMEILDHPVPVKNAENAQAFPLPSGDVVFAGVSFSYGGDRAAVVEGLDLRLPAGKTTALVGHTGAGKSTLSNLVLRYYDVTAGSISIGPLDVREIDLQQLRSHIGLVAQEPFLFDGSVRENLLLARPEATETDLWQALEAAHAADFVRRLPEGLDTPIGERGVRLSVGEKQRLTIARVILKNPPIVILDEATASVDTLTEHKIQAALDRLMKDRTVLIIAHRLSTVRKADQIIVLQQGRIIEQGSHQTLIRRGGHYARLWAIQSDLIPEITASSDA